MASDFPRNTEIPDEQLMLELALEAARRANWDALRGPEHLRSGRYIVSSEPARVDDAPERDSSPAGGHPTG